MRLNCRDCGEELPAKLERSSREDVCDACWDNRLLLVSGKLGNPGDPSFTRIQKAMANGRGTAKKLIEAKKGSI